MMKNIKTDSQKMLGGSHNFDAKSAHHLAMGLQNIGNTCFLNSSIQGLSSLTKFLVFMRNRQDLIEFYPNKTSAQLSPILYRTLMAVYWRGNGKIPIPEVTRFQPIKKKFITNEQQDSHEFFHYLLTYLNDEVDFGSHISPLLTAITYFGCHPHFLKSLFFSNGSKIISNPSSIEPESNPLIGFLQGTLKCEGCKQTFEPTYQQFIDLSLTIPNDDLTLEGCLKNFTQPEVVSDIRCEHCKTRNKGKKQMTIAQAPRILCLHIRRIIQNMRGTFEKVNTHVEFPLQLDIEPYCTKFVSQDSPGKANPVKKAPISTLSGGRTIPGGESFGHANQFTNVTSTTPPLRVKTSGIWYNLASVVVHSGTHRGGHYTVFKKILSNTFDSKEKFMNFSKNFSPMKENSWVQISDEQVQTATERQVLNSQAYMLFYESCS